MSAAENKAVFLSYASQDATAVVRIAEALRASGVEVWFDQNELVGGDAWDAKIRKQIADCALFVPIISASTQARLEGYFRLEWKLAAQRTHTMADEKAFLLPVVIDATRDAEAKVPAEFKTVQWTKLPGGETPEKFCARVKALLSGEGRDASPRRPSSGAGERHGRLGETSLPAKSSRPWLGPTILGAAAVMALALWQPWRGKEKPAPAISPTGAIAPGTPLTEAQQLVAKARKIFDEGDEMNRETYTLAEELLKKAETLDVAEGSAWALHAQVSAQSYLYGLDNSPARREAMLVESARATKLTPDSLDAVLASANVRLALRQEIPALEESFKKLAEANPQDPQVLRVLVRAYGLDGKADDASAAARQALRLAPDDPKLKADLVNYLRIINRFAEAEAALTEAKNGRMNARLWAFDSSLRLVWRGDSAGAAASLRNWPSWFFLEDRGAAFAAIVFMWNREPAKAIEVLGNFPRDEIEDTWAAGPRAAFTAMAREQLGQSESVRADWRVALQVADRKLSTAPDDAVALHWKAWALARLGDLPAAGAIFNQLREKSPVLPSSLYLFGGLAGLAETMGQSAEVINYLRPNRYNGTGFERPLTKGILRLNPVFDPLRSDPRFQALVEAAPTPEEKKENVNSAAPGAAPDKSVAVLAFADDSPARDSEYFSDGISQELIGALGKVPGLKVPARTSSFYFKGKNLPLADIARQLGVAYVIEGSVQRAGEKVKIRASLTKASDGFQVWSDGFTRDAKDVFAVEEEIAGIIARQLSLKLGASSGVATGSVNPQAFELYLQADQLMRLRDTIFTNTDRVEELLNRALALEPNFARAQAMLAEIWVARGSMQTSINNRFGRRHSPERERIEAKARQVIALDPTAPEPHVALGLGMWTWWDREGAEKELRAAIALNPSHTGAHRQLAFVVMDDGRMDEAMAEANLAVQLDPFSQSVIESQARILHVAGRYTEAIAAYDRALALADSVIAREHKAYALAQLGQKEAALALGRSLPDGPPRFRPFAAAGARAEAEKILPDTEPQNRAYYLLMLGRTEEAIAAFDPDEMQSTYLHDVLFEPWFDPVRDHPRFKSILATLGVTEAHARAQAWRAAHPAEKAEQKK